MADDPNVMVGEFVVYIRKFVFGHVAGSTILGGHGTGATRMGRVRFLGCGRHVTGEAAWIVGRGAVEQRLVGIVASGTLDTGIVTPAGTVLQSIGGKTYARQPKRAGHLHIH